MSGDCIGEDESLSGHERKAVIPCDGDDDSAPGVLVKIAWDEVGLDGNRIIV